MLSSWPCMFRIVEEICRSAFLCWDVIAKKLNLVLLTSLTCLPFDFRYPFRTVNATLWKQNLFSS